MPPLESQESRNSYAEISFLAHSSMQYSYLCFIFKLIFLTHFSKQKFCRSYSYFKTSTLSCYIYKKDFHFQISRNCFNRKIFL